MRARPTRVSCTVGAMTDRYGVVGSPIAHSLSPAIHNAAFEVCGIDAEYRAYDVPAGYDEFCGFVDNARLRGLSVTLPHKENALRYAGRNAEALASKIGAANTLLLAGAEPYACNTDYPAILSAICDVLEITLDDLAGVKVAVLGAGGAARAAVAGLAACGSTVRIYNRTRARADELADEFGAQAADWDDRGGLDAAIVVNATSVGLAPNVDASPLPAEALRGDLVVFDTIYNPLETRLLREARAAGARTIDGLEMFVRQGADQFQRFTDHEAPVEVMRAAALATLSAG